MHVNVVNGWNLSFSLAEADQNEQTLVFRLPPSDISYRGDSSNCESDANGHYNTCLQTADYNYEDYSSFCSFLTEVEDFFDADACENDAINFYFFDLDACDDEYDDDIRFCEIHF